ncbi:MAG: hypothetical protein JO112_24035 [Planctomycetes bacterium]|nr:hypothetical protein [Planctomycetota bacterium]
MNRPIAEQIAALLNGQNHLNAVYHADQIWQSKNEYIYELDPKRTGSGKSLPLVLQNIKILPGSKTKGGFIQESRKENKMLKNMRGSAGHLTILVSMTGFLAIANPCQAQPYTPPQGGTPAQAYPTPQYQPLGQFARAEDKIDLTGTWYTPDDPGCIISMRQIGSEVWWVSKSPKDNGKSFTAPGHGTILGKRLVGTFADVPAGQYRHYGTFNLDLVIEDGKVMRLSGYIQIDESKPDAHTFSRVGGVRSEPLNGSRAVPGAMGLPAPAMARPGNVR